MRIGKIYTLKIARTRRSVLFTLGMLLVTLSILSFAKLVFEESEDERTLFQTAVLANRADDLYSSIEKSIISAFNLYSGINVSRNNYTVIFEEPLPNDISSFESSILKLKNITESNDAVISLGVYETTAEFPLFIQPQNITYKHDFSLDDITIITPDDAGSRLSKYRTVIAVADNVTCSWSYTNGDFNYELEVISPHESGCSQSRAVDLGAGATITITSQADSSNKIIISLSQGSFSIRGSSEFSAAVRNELSLMQMPGSVFLGDNLISVSFARFGLSRTGGARII